MLHDLFTSTFGKCLTALDEKDGTLYFIVFNQPAIAYDDLPTSSAEIRHQSSSLALPPLKVATLL
jgi:hypothetical protein